MAKSESHFIVETHTNKQHYPPEQSQPGYGLSPAGPSHASSSIAPSSVAGKVCVGRSSYLGQVRQEWRQHIIAGLP